MAQIKTTVRTEIIDEKGESFVVERGLVTDIRDDPRSWAAAARVELEVGVETNISHIVHQHGPSRP
jgi:hypothetical protein